MTNHNVRLTMALLVAVVFTLFSATTAFLQSQCNPLYSPTTSFSSCVALTLDSAAFLQSQPTRGTVKHSPTTHYASAADDIVPSAAEKMTCSASVPRILDRQEGQALMDTDILPANGYGSRIQVGRDAQGLEAASGVAVSPNDPRMFLTYGEFSLTSLDELLDLALPYVSTDAEARINMVDVGSGCGRLALYAALTRGTLQQPWTVHGIEISPILHHEAVQALSKAMNSGHVQDHEPLSSCHSSILLHAGPAQAWKEVFQECNLVFAYSTAWPTNGFSPELGAMIIGQEWSGLLATSCPNGCVAITTDRALDPQHGWELVERLDVDNREVMGSTGYVQVLRRR